MRLENAHFAEREREPCSSSLEPYAQCGWIVMET